MRYRLKDTKEAIMGSFVTTLFFFALRAGEPGPYLPSMEVGIIISLAWVFAVWKSFKNVPNGEHFFVNIFLVFGFCSVLSIAFGMTTFEEIKASPFTSPAIIASWMALPVALLFDKYNVGSILSRYYIRGKG